MTKLFTNILLSILILLQTCFIVLVSAKDCTTGNCNNAGTCTTNNNNNQINCSCIGNYFSGTRCQELRNQCSESSPCKNGATCESGFGQFVCKCNGKFGGQHCDVAGGKATFTKMHILFNPIGIYGEQQNFLLTIETLGARSFKYESFTNKSLIDAFESVVAPVGQAASAFHYANNLRSVAETLGLLHANRIPYTSGYYRGYSQSFWEVGLITTRVHVVDLESNVLVLYEQAFDIYIIQPPNVPCIPDVHFMHGQNPQEPLMVDIARFNIFNVIIHKHCTAYSRLEIGSWSVYNRIGTVQLYDFGNPGKRQLKVKPYRFWFTHEGTVAQSYMMQVNANENFDNTIVHKRVRQCYVSIVSKPVSAFILGGVTREVGVGQSFDLDGSKSRDFALSPLVEQKMKFMWSCVSSDDSTNPHCSSNMGTDKILNIPAGALQLGKSYTYTLIASSYISTTETSEAKQTIKIINERKHYVYIECVRNCEAGKFASKRKVHLRMRCPTCSAATQPNSITWKLSSGDDGGGGSSNAQRIGFKPPASGRVAVEVAVSSDAVNGRATIELTHNEPPKGGRCSIMPTLGVEYKTEFHIECEDFTHPNWPILYQYATGTFTFDRTTERLINTRLPQSHSIQIAICDTLHACTETRIAVSVIPMNELWSEAALMRLLSKADTNMRQIVQDGDIERAMVLADVLTRTTRNLGMGELIYQQLEAMKLETLLHIEQFTKVTRNLMKPLQPLDYKRVGLFTKFFRKISAGFQYIIADREFQELLPETYDNINNEVVDMIAEFAAKLENMPPIVRMEPASSGSANRLLERYAPLPDFDDTVLTRIENWLDVIYESFRCLHFVGIAGTVMHEPTDDHYKLAKPGVVVDVFSVEGMKLLALLTENRKIEIIIPAAMLAEIERILHSAQLLFQLISFERNPFWWYPDTEPLSTGIVAFSVYSINDPFHAQTYLRNPIEFRMALNTNNTTTRSTYRIVGFVNDAHDMPIYRFEMPENTAAVVKFSNATTRLCIKLNLCTKPRSYQVRTCADIVHAERNFHIVNDVRGGSAWAYLAVMAADEIAAREFFQFEVNMLKCLTWDFNLREPAWSTKGCVPKVLASDPAAENVLTCSCYHLSTYAGKKHSTAATQTDDRRRVLTHLPINISTILFFLFLIVVFALLFCWAHYTLYHHKGDLVACSVPQADQVENQQIGVYMHLSTGGHWCAASTANISIVIALPQGTRKFIVSQNPEDPHLVRNSTCTLRLPLSGGDLAQPLLLSIRRDTQGRYPSWYCRSVIIEDYANGIICSFEVEQWITTKPLVLDAMNFHEGPQQFKRNFWKCLEGLFIQWFLFQPLLGPWKYGDMTLNRFERTCIWIVKLALTICIVCSYLGATTLRTYEQERDKYQNIVCDWTEIFFLCISTYVICFFVELALKAFIYHDELVGGKSAGDDERRLVLADEEGL